jgi:O-antigen/teichoic acid export membrane protein
VVSAVLNAILIPRWAHFGAAWATFWAESAVLAVQLVLVRRHYRIFWPWANIAKYLLAAFAMSAFLVVVRRTVPESSLWLRLALDVPLGAAIYFALLSLLKEEFAADVLAKLKGRFAHG